MELEKLLEMQKTLDERIIKLKGLKGQDLVPGTILALRMELGELANELPEHTKHWSNKKNNMDKVLEEYVDGLHFILSLGNQTRMAIRTSTGSLKETNIQTQLNVLFDIITDFSNYRTEFVYYCLLQNYIGLGEMLGFSWEQIIQAYIAKNQVNRERQENGY